MLASFTSNVNFFRRFWLVACTILCYKGQVSSWQAGFIHVMEEQPMKVIGRGARPCRNVHEVHHIW